MQPRLLARFLQQGFRRPDALPQGRRREFFLRCPEIQGDLDGRGTPVTMTRSLDVHDYQHTPFPQIDIIGAMVIVWRVRGKTIRSVLCNIVCNDCAQCDAHRYEQTNSSLDWVLSHWAHFTVLRFIFMVTLCNRADHYIFMLWFVLSSSIFLFFPRLISAAADWMSVILPHMVWP